jgi:K+-transporting ATPase ATPase A chain
MFLSAATGMAVGAALARGFARRGVRTIGCFLVDMIRSLIYVLLPLAIISGAIFIALGTVQSLAPPVT